MAGKMRNQRGSVQAIGEVVSNSDASFLRITQLAKEYEKLNRVVGRLLGPILAALCQVSCLQSGTLVLHTPTPTGATRLRLILSQLLSSLRQEGFNQIARIEIRVVPLASKQKQKLQTRHLSAAAKESLREFSVACKDPAMKAIAKRMSKR